MCTPRACRMHDTRTAHTRVGRVHNACTLRAQHAHAACTPFAHRRAPRDALAETHLATRLTAASFALSPATLCVRRVYGASQARGAHAALHDACAARARRTCRPRAQRVRTLRVQRAHAARVPCARRMLSFLHIAARRAHRCSLLLISPRGSPPHHSISRLQRCAAQSGVQPHAARVPRTRAWMFALRRAAPLLPLLSSPRGDRRCIVRSCVRNAVAAGVRHTRNMYPPRRAVRSPWLCTAPLTAASFGARVHDAHRSTTGTERCGSRAQRAHDARGPRARRMLAVCTSPRAAPTVSLAAAHLAARGSPPHRSLSYHIVHSRVPYAATTHITPTWALRRHGGASHC